MNATTTLAGSCLAISCLAVVAFAQTPTSRPTKNKKSTHNIKMDALARATFERGEALEYHLGRAGVKTVSFTVKVTAKSPLGDAEATGKYTFNGKKGTLKWDNAGLGTMLEARGWSRDTFDKLFIADSHRAGLKNTELTAEKKGDATIITVSGNTEAGVKTLHYDKNGVSRKFTMQVSNPNLRDADAAIALKHEKIGGKHVRTGWSVDLPTTMGAFHGDVAIKNKKVGKFHVFDTVEEKQTLAGKSVGSTTMAFSDYKINGAITETKKAGTTAKPTSSKPTSKPTEKKGPPKV